MFGCLPVNQHLTRGFLRPLEEQISSLQVLHHLCGPTSHLHDSLRGTRGMLGKVFDLSLSLD